MIRQAGSTNQRLHVNDLFSNGKAEKPWDSRSKLDAVTIPHPVQAVVKPEVEPISVQIRCQNYGTEIGTPDRPSGTSIVSQWRRTGE